MRDIREIKDDYREACNMKRSLEQEMADAVENFEGTVMEALQAGLIKCNFPTPPYLLRRIAPTTGR